MDIRTYLKDLPSGTTLYSLVSGEVTFKEIKKDVIVVLDYNHCEQLYHFTGRLWNSGLDGECLLFPSKELRDWTIFTKFKKGDIIISGQDTFAIVDHIGDFGSCKDVVYYQACYNTLHGMIIKTDVGVGHTKACRHACESDKKYFLSVLDQMGYTVKDGCVVKKKFDPQSFEPFQKVLVRATSTSNWRCTFFSHMGSDKAVCSGDNWSYCIPYENNEYLRGKANDCDDFYKWWENK